MGVNDQLITRARVINEREETPGKGPPPRACRARALLLHQDFSLGQECFLKELMELNRTQAAETVVPWCEGISGR